MNQTHLKTLANTKLSENAIQRLANIFVNLSNEDTMKVWLYFSKTEFEVHNISNLHSSTGTVLLTGEKVTVCSHVVRVISEGYENPDVDNALSALEQRYLG